MARVALALALFALALVPAAAGADSLVYVKGGNVWISHSDGSAARQVTSAPNNWAWPSTADDGTVFAAGGAQRVNLDGSDSDGSTEIYRMDQSGRQIGPFLETPAEALSTVTTWIGAIEAQWDQRLAALRSYLLEEPSTPSVQEKEPHAEASSPQDE